MARKRKVPELQCPTCQAPVVIIPVGRRYKQCNRDAVRVYEPGGRAVVGYAEHTCVVKAPTKRTRRMAAATGAAMDVLAAGKTESTPIAAEAAT